ncbi:MAG: hypothetical protein A2785_03215 [Candidatus Chisholmbacteria bacterium RIFCSPHIGHO2_01_FULL_49_18]|uniref:Uncharacterized protein n=1 Tax=Candidatus Chisholmbacteria bacterium RIFCSPHIGHO2_01_FULL_49_18 TaxID=1797590 RepID=A0A1G1VMF1_9BACT|nr:MAG: hypothetical protein A2785_03215 [Candidatus Chisholmbacteria bacterium RIFCSPHIGHO2_01_FULL_49_18]
MVELRALMEVVMLVVLDQAVDVPVIAQLQCQCLRENNGLKKLLSRFFTKKFLGSKIIFTRVYRKVAARIFFVSHPHNF